jgi:nucleoside-diphosphate kinase
MAIERTLSIIKPDAVKKNVVGACLAKLNEAGLQVVGIRAIQLSKEQARAFYAVHEKRPFYNSLVEFMTSGPVVISVLEGENAIAANRKVMGATDPAKAEEGTIRKAFGDNIEQNAVHGSDAPETAKNEISFFFPECELVRYAR